MKKVLRFYGLFMCFISRVAFAANTNTASGLPWEKPIELIQKSLSYVGGSLVLIGIVWAGYAFLVQGEKEQGFKRLITTIIGGAVIFGATSIVSTCFGAVF